VRRRFRAGRPLALAAAVLLLTACGGILPVPKAPSNLYNLSPKSNFDPGLPRVEWQLVIEEPVAAGGLDTARIAVRPSPLELGYFGDIRWTERAPKMVQTLLVESFENSGTIVAVGRQAIGLRADFSLKTEIREFQVEDFGGGKIRVRINAKLIRQPRQIIVRSASFEAAVDDPPTESMEDSIRAWDEAMGTVLRDIVEWTIVEGQRAYGR
jgi:cholesterol transport system auxiliary component